MQIRLRVKACGEPEYLDKCAQPRNWGRRVRKIIVWNQVRKISAESEM